VKACNPVPAQKSPASNEGIPNLQSLLTTGASYAKIPRHLGRRGGLLGGEDSLFDVRVAPLADVEVSSGLRGRR